MKILIIGMDGAQINTFKRGWTPFIESLIEKGEQLELKEDLISRGWAEIFTGKHGIETGALYDRPSLKGNYEWSLKFKIGDIPGLGTDVKPIWQVLNERGYKVGIMNVPTTFPAPVVEGFFVSGGGGGSKVIQDPTEELCYPKEILSTLTEMGYIVDERIGSLIGEKRFYQSNKIFARLEEKNQKRTQAFIRLSKDFKVDFGFVVFKSSSVMAELFLIPEWNRYLSGKNKIDHQLLESIKHYYALFDKQVKHLAEIFPEAEIILVSDHSMDETKYLINLNAFLQQHDFQKVSIVNRKSNLLFHYIKKYLKPLIPFHVRYALRQKAKIEISQKSENYFDGANTLAFCMPMYDWCSGIYINDKKRFNGPVDSKDVSSLSSGICSVFNKLSLAQKHGLKCRMKPASNSPAASYFPDIILDCPDGYLVSNSSSNFLDKFEMPNEPIDIQAWINKFKCYCIKAHYPIAVNTKKWLEKPTAEKHDLRLVYDHILATFL